MRGVEHDVSVQNGSVCRDRSIAMEIAQRGKKRASHDFSPVRHGDRAIAFAADIEIAVVGPFGTRAGHRGCAGRAGCIAEVAATVQNIDAAPGIADDLPTRLDGKRAGARIADEETAAAVVGPFGPGTGDRSRARRAGFIAEVAAPVITDLPTRLDGERTIARVADEEIAAVPFGPGAGDGGRARRARAVA